MVKVNISTSTKVKINKFGQYVGKTAETTYTAKVNVFIVASHNF